MFIVFSMNPVKSKSFFDSSGNEVYILFRTDEVSYISACFICRLAAMNNVKLACMHGPTDSPCDLTVVSRSALSRQHGCHGPQPTAHEAECSVY